jgi:hypothetical protein
MITVTVFHNVARDGQGRPTGMLDGYQPCDPIVRVFTYQADPAGRDGADRRGGVRHLQRPPPRHRRRRTGPPLLPTRAAVTVVPRKDAVLPEVMLRPPESRVVRMAVDWLPGYEASRVMAGLHGQVGAGMSRGMLAGTGFAWLDDAGLVGPGLPT